MITINCNCEGCEFKSLFMNNLDQEQYNVICKQKREIIYKTGSFIFKEGDPIENFSYLKRGLVKLVKNVNTKIEQIIFFGQPLDFVSLLDIFYSKVYQYSVIALEESTVCYLPMSTIKQIATINGNFTLNLAEKNEYR